MQHVGRPKSFDEDLSAAWSIWLLDHELPEPPSTVVRGQSVPVARWAGPRFGAVLHVQWIWSLDQEEADDDYLATVVQVLRRRGDDWEVAGGEGGGSWEAPNLWTSPLAPTVVHFEGLSCSGERDWWCCATYGLAGAGAHFVEVEDDEGVTRLPAELRLSTFIAAFDGTTGATVRVLDSSEGVLAERAFDAVRPS